MTGVDTDANPWAFVATAVVIASLLWAIAVLTSPRRRFVALAAVVMSVGLIVYFR